jgi:hypothetical protein
MLFMACILLFAVGHVIRDGFPALGSTHGARALGAFSCLLGGLCVLAWPQAALVGLGVLAGFYIDQKHAAGQQARGWSDAGWLTVSGITSIAPLALVTLNPWLLLIGLVKPGIWFAAWRIPFFEDSSFWYPTRVSAGVFGAVIGLAVGVL